MFKLNFNRCTRIQSVDDTFLGDKVRNIYNSLIIQHMRKFTVIESKEFHFSQNTELSLSIM